MAGLTWAAQEPSFAPAVDARLEEYYSSGPLADDLAELARRFREEKYVEIGWFLPPSLRAEAEAEVTRLLQNASARREVLMPMSGNSPRYFSSVGWDVIDASGAIIPAVYHSTALQKLVCTLTGEYLVHAPYAPERYLITRMHEEGDTHGWHWDDYAYALVWIVQAPLVGQGGSLQYVRNTKPTRERAGIEAILRQNKVAERHPATGSAYLLRTDTSLHRTRPLGSKVERVVVSMAFANASDLRSPARHDSWQALFSEVPGLDRGE